ncbi:hypothetical protein [Streptomyces sp. NPDC052042]
MRRLVRGDALLDTGGLEPGQDFVDVLAVAGRLPDGARCERHPRH